MLRELDTAFVEKVEQAKMDAHVKLRAFDVDGAVSLIGPFLKLAPIVLARVLSLEGSGRGDDDWRQRFKSSQPPALVNEIETFLRETTMVAIFKEIGIDWCRMLPSKPSHKLT